MTELRIKRHPVLPVPGRPEVAFTWQGAPLSARKGETIASALFANGIRTFGHHAKDGAPQGIFCADGQCAQCLVLVDGLPVKSCMELAPGRASGSFSPGWSGGPSPCRMKRSLPTSRRTANSKDSKGSNDRPN